MYLIKVLWMRVVVVSDPGASVPLGPQAAAIRAATAASLLLPCYQQLVATCTPSFL